MIIDSFPGNYFFCTYLYRYNDQLASGNFKFRALNWSCFSIFSVPGYQIYCWRCGNIYSSVRRFISYISGKDEKILSSSQLSLLGTQGYCCSLKWIACQNDFKLIEKLKWPLCSGTFFMLTLCFSSLQTVVLTCLKKTIGLKNCVLIGLIFEILQLSWYGLGTQFW